MHHFIAVLLYRLNAWEKSFICWLPVGSAASVAVVEERGIGTAGGVETKL
jgi:hypothetical protein